MMRESVFLLIGLAVSGCDARISLAEGPPEKEAARPTWSRASLRAYDGAPPVIPHKAIEGARCEVCHDHAGREISGLGVAPPSPHGKTEGMSSARCRQCHVYAEVHDEFVPTTFGKWWTGTRSGSRLYSGAPPVAPHRLFMHEDCNACHAGKAARPEIRTTHPDRGRCAACHAFATANDEFVR